MHFLLVAVVAASLIQFIHNAEFLADYPGPPQMWTRAGMFGVGVGMTRVGLIGLAPRSRR